MFVLFLLISRKFNARCFPVFVAAEELPAVDGILPDKEWTFLLLWRSKNSSRLDVNYLFYDTLRDILINILELCIQL